MVRAVLAGNPARFDDILTHHRPGLAASLDGLVERWWIGRHRHLIRLDADQHLTLTFRLTDPAHHPQVAASVARFAADLRTRGLPGQLSLVPYSGATRACRRAI
jgi:hypothetical protein